MSNGTIIRSVTDAIAVVSQIIESAENEVAWLVPRPSLFYALQFGIIEQSKMLIQHGVRMRGIVDFSYPYIDAVRKLLDTGQEVYHVYNYQGMFMVIADAKSISSMSIITESFSIDSPILALWSDDPTYAEYLMSTFERVWEHSVPAAQRIEELLNEGPPDIYEIDGVVGSSRHRSETLHKFQKRIQIRGFDYAPFNLRYALRDVSK